jgi:RNA polymerase II subunit A-like phosphatase
VAASAAAAPQPQGRVIFGGLDIETGERVETSHQPMTTTALIGSASLKFDRTAARHADQSARARLAASSKLVLVCDLDATLIHATTERDLSRHGDLDRIERLAAAQQAGHGEPDLYPIMVPGRAGAPHDRHWLKLRPFCRKFLAAANELYELWIYTHGTRSYAEQIQAVIDPERALFGSRCIARDDVKEGSAMDVERCAVHIKTLAQIFPDANSAQDSNLSITLVIDDKTKVWKERANVLEVRPYVFYGTTSARGEDAPAAAPAAPSAAAPSAAAPERASASAAESAAEKSAASAVSAASAAAARLLASEHARLDTDSQLRHVLRMLKRVHREHFAHRGRGAGSAPEVDVRRILRQSRLGTLFNVSVVFSGRWPVTVTEAEVRADPLWQQASAFGAHCSRELQEHTTHVIAWRGVTPKVRRAARMAGVWIVTPEWLAHSVESWRRLDEQGFTLPEMARGKGHPFVPMAGRPRPFPNALKRERDARLQREIHHAAHVSGSAAASNDVDDDSSDDDMMAEILAAKEVAAAASDATASAAAAAPDDEAEVEQDEDGDDLLASIDYNDDPDDEINGSASDGEGNAEDEDESERRALAQLRRMLAR